MKLIFLHICFEKKYLDVKFIFLHICFERKYLDVKLILGRENKLMEGEGTTARMHIVEHKSNTYQFDTMIETLNNAVSIF